MTTMKMYVKRNGKRVHETIEVTVDWSGLSDADLRVMCHHYLMNRVAHDSKANDHKLPERVTVRAKDYLHNEPLVQLDYKGPPQERKWSKAAQELQDAFKHLSPAELKQLLGG